MTRHRALLLPFTLLIAIVCLPGSAGAQSNEATPVGTPEPTSPTFAISQRDPSDTPYFSVELEPGESADLVALAQTIESIPATLWAFSTNAINPANGGFDAGTEEDELIGAATWVAFPAQTLEMSGTEAVEIPFSVTVPTDATPGQYVAALVLQTADPLAVEGTTLIDVLVRSVIAVEINVPGPKDVSFELGEPTISSEAGPIQLVIPIANTGNYRVGPTGEITIATSDGETVTTAPVVLGSIYGGNETTVTIDLPQQFEAGDYVISGTLTDPESDYSVTISPTNVAFVPANTTTAQFTLDPVSITASGDPVQFADVAITINNSGDTIPTGKVVLAVSKDGELLEEYVLSQNQAMPQGTSTISQRYIPATGWESGTYTFELIVYSVDANGTESVIATVPIEDTIEIS